MNSPAVASIEPVAAIARALPAWTYHHPEMARLEYERILKPSWQILCHINAIPNPGDYMTLDIGSDSVVAVRNSKREIQAFHNVCRHRGAKILDGAGHCPGAITCPYHGWSYRLSGELQGMTMRETFPGLDRAQFGLRPVRMQIQFGFVFVWLAGEPSSATALGATAPGSATPPSLESIWGEFLDDFTPYRFEQMVPLAPLYYEDWAVDWKVAMDNYLESYHVPIGHPGLYRMFTPDYDDQKSLPGGVARGTSHLREQPLARWSERRYQQLVGQAAPELPEALRTRWSFYSMLPNLGIDVFPDQMDFFQVLPRGPGQCTIRGGTFGLPDASRELRAVRYLNARINRQVQREDEFLCRRVQRGLASSSYEPGPLSRLESCMWNFHELLRERIPEARHARAPALFA
jgi:phenylpropionate dioxygenase-like ring-hydroxylating dioxygenase large terminal subunit